MAKGAYIGVSSKARKVKKMYIGIGGVAHAVKKAYIGVGGKARLFWSGESFRAYAYGMLIGSSSSSDRGRISLYDSNNETPSSFNNLGNIGKGLNGKSRMVYDTANKRFVWFTDVSGQYVKYCPKESSTWTAASGNALSWYSNGYYAIYDPYLGTVDWPTQGYLYRIDPNTGNNKSTITFSTSSGRSFGLPAIDNGYYISAMNRNSSDPSGAYVYYAPYASTTATQVTYGFYGTPLYYNYTSSGSNAPCIVYYNGYFYVAGAGRYYSTNDTLVGHSVIIRRATEPAQLASSGTGENYLYSIKYVGSYDADAGWAFGPSYFWKGKFFWNVNHTLSGIFTSTGTWYCELGKSSGSLVRGSSYYVYNEYCYTSSEDKIYRTAKNSSTSTDYDVLVQYSIDGINWTTCYTFTSPAGTYRYNTMNICVSLKS